MNINKACPWAVIYQFEQLLTFPKVISSRQLHSPNHLLWGSAVFSGTVKFTRSSRPVGAPCLDSLRVMAMPHGLRFWLSRSCPLKAQILQTGRGSRSAMLWASSFLVTQAEFSCQLPQKPPLSPKSLHYLQGSAKSSCGLFKDTHCMNSVDVRASALAFLL